MRAFAVKAGLSSGALSEVLAGKRSLSSVSFQRIASRLKLCSTQTESVLAMVRESDSIVKCTPAPRLELDRDRAKVLADWVYTAILSLAETEGQEISSDLNRSPVAEKMVRTFVGRLSAVLDQDDLRRSFNLSSNLFPVSRGN